MKDDLATQIAKLAALQAEAELLVKRHRTCQQETVLVKSPSLFSRIRAFVSRYAMAIIMCTLLGIAAIGTISVCRISDEACRKVIDAAAIGAAIGAIVGVLGGR